MSVTDPAYGLLMMVGVLLCIPVAAFFDVVETRRRQRDQPHDRDSEVH